MSARTANARRERLGRRLRRARIALQLRHSEPALQRVAAGWWLTLLAALALLLVGGADWQLRRQLEQQRVLATAFSALGERARRAQRALDEQTMGYRALASAPPPTWPPAAALAGVGGGPVVAPVASPATPSPRLPSPRVALSSRRSPAPTGIEQALARLRAGRDDRALQWLSERAQALVRGGHWAALRQRVERAAQPEGFFQLGVLLAAAGQPERALVWLERAAAARDDGRYWRALAVAADRAERPRLALRAYRRALALGGPDSVALRARVQALAAR